MSHWEATGKSDQWYTPRYVFEAMGNPRFDLDAAAPKLIPAYINARHWFWEGALERPWEGFVWMNPPFGGRNAIAAWLEKFIEHGNGIALTPDRTSAPWFQEAFPKMDLALFTPKIRFRRPNGAEGKSPSNGTALLAIGDLGIGALRRAQCAGLGILTKPLSPTPADQPQRGEGA